MRIKYNKAVYDLEMFKKVSEAGSSSSKASEAGSSPNKQAVEQEIFTINYEKIVALQQKEIEKLQSENKTARNELASMNSTKLELLENVVELEKSLKESESTNVQLEQEKQNIVGTFQRSAELLTEENSILKSSLESDKKAKEDQIALKDIEMRKQIDITSSLQKRLDQVLSMKKIFYLREIKSLNPYFIFIHINLIF